MNSAFDQFVADWVQGAFLGFEIGLVAAAAFLLIYIVLLIIPRSLPGQYEFVNANEIRFLWYVGLSLTLSGTLYFEYWIVNAFYTSGVFELVIKTVGTAMVGFLVGYSIKMYLNVYYPFILERRLHRIRFKPRRSKSGNKMILLDEESEDVHLTEEMIRHEELNAFEYDVWLDEKTGDKIIEKYKGKEHLVICDNCNYRTSHEVGEEVISEPSYTVTGTLRKRYKCHYCDHVQEHDVEIAALRDTEDEPISSASAG